MASGAGKQASFLLDGNSQIVVSTYGWPGNWAMAWDIHCNWSDNLSGSGWTPAQMGLQLPPGTQVVDGPGTQTYYLLVQNVGSVNGGFDMCYLYHSF